MTEEGKLDLKTFVCDGSQRKLSDPIYIGGLAWKILVNPCTIIRYHAKALTQYKALQFFLECNGGDDSPTWSFHASAALHIMSGKEGVDDIVHQIVHNFTNENNTKYFGSITCDVLFDASYGFNALTLQVNTEVPRKAMKRKFVSSIPDEPDAILIIGTNRIPIHKMYLSFYSVYFKTMFQSEFKEASEDEIVIEEVEYGEMIELLSVIYPSAAPINDKNIKSILKLANRFIMTAVLERCKEIIRNSTIIKGAEKLLLAQHYNFTDLQKELAKQYKTVQDVKKLKSEAAYNQLDSNTLVLLFHSITS